ncbi:hypothetical protein [Dyella psychrodurans]|uniref:Bacterial Ig-like domain-containing protein n=1 Tax=Dyella psychrodurans TaxID=1927960 RepID=A0A370XCF6_9GAMM|nr:hypothetical protein [Dyella psychrodurans]RDS86088.1 hypothetical protein DWU99_02115 [Dyella psychrodurans]
MSCKNTCRALLGLSLITLACSSAFAGDLPVDGVGRATLVRLLDDSQVQSANDLPPIVRIVSPLADSSIAGGTSTHKVGSFNGTNMAVNVEVVTRDNVPLVVREATEAPPVFGIRHVNDLLADKPNPDAPGLYVFFDQPLIMPDGTVMPAFSNFASAFNVSGSDDTPGPGRTTWFGWHVLESLPAGTQEVTMTVAFVDSAHRVAFDQVHLNVDRTKSSGQALTPAPQTFAGPASVIDDGQGPEVSMIAPRVPTSIAIGPTDSSLNATNGSLFFIQVSSLDRNRHGIAVSANGLTSAGAPLNAAIPAGLIFDPSVIPSAGHPGGPNRNFPGLTVTFDVPLRQPNGNIVPAGANLAGLFDVAGNEVDASGAIRTTADWVVGGSLMLPPGKQNVTVNASVTDNAGHTGSTKNIFSISKSVSGQQLTLDPPPSN